MRLMEKMGWKPGQGLGRNAAGPIEPLYLDVKADKKGYIKWKKILDNYLKASFLSTLNEFLNVKVFLIQLVSLCFLHFTHDKYSGKNPVSVLMEVCSRNRWMNPEFVCDEMGPHNNRRYLWKVCFERIQK